MKNRASAEALTLLHPQEPLERSQSVPTASRGFYITLEGLVYPSFVRLQRTPEGLADGKDYPLRCPCLTNTTNCAIIRKTTTKKRLVTTEARSANS